jgi:hypothetical protein
MEPTSDTITHSTLHNFVTRVRNDQRDPTPNLYLFLQGYGAIATGFTIKGLGLYTWYCFSTESSELDFKKLINYVKGLSPLMRGLFCTTIVCFIPALILSIPLTLSGAHAVDLAYNKRSLDQLASELSHLASDKEVDKTHLKRAADLLDSTNGEREDLKAIASEWQKGFLTRCFESRF